jgi:hypothetical protein
MVGTEEVQIKKSKHTVISKGREESLIIVICTFSPPGNVICTFPFIVFEIFYFNNKFDS